MHSKYIIIKKISDSDANMWGTTGEHPRLLLKNAQTREKSTDLRNFSDVTYGHCFTLLNHAEKTMNFLKSVNPTHVFYIATFSK